MHTIIIYLSPTSLLLKAHQHMCTYTKFISHEKRENLFPEEEDITPN